MLSWIIENSLVAGAMAALILVICKYQSARPALCHMLWVLVMVRLVLPPLPIPSFTDTLIDDLATPVAQTVQNVAQSATPDTATPLEPLVLDQVTATVTNKRKNSTQPSSQTPTPHVSQYNVEYAPAPAPARVPANVAPGPLSSVLSRITLSGLLLSLWLLVSLTILVRRLRDIRQLRSLLRLSAQPPQWLVTEATRTAVRMDMEPPPVKLLPGIGSPFVWGLGQPTLYWPEDWAQSGMDPATPPVLAHELAHLRRRDHLVAWLELILLIALWWHPLFWLAKNRIRYYAEPACDAWAVWIYPDNRRAYADALIEAISPNPHIPTVAALSTNTEHRNFKRRLIMIMRKGSFQQVPKVWFAAGLCLTLLVSPSWSAKPAPINAAPAVAAAPADNFDQAVEAAVLQHRAKRLHKAKNYHEAAELYKKAAAKMPNDSHLQRRLGSAMLHAGRYGEAVKAFKKQNKLDSDHHNGWFDLARAYAGAGRDSDALDALEKAVDFSHWNTDRFAEPEFENLSDNPRFAKIMQRSMKIHRLYRQAERSKDHGEFEDAQASYDKLLALAPKSPRLHSRLGYNFIKSGEYVSAEKAFRKQLELDPKSATAAYNLACTLSLQGDAAAALSMVQKSVDLGWNSWNHMLNDSDLAAVRELSGFETLISDNENSEDLEHLYEIAEKQKDYDEALSLLDQLQKVAENDHEKAQVFHEKAMVQYKTGDYLGSAHSFKQAIGLGRSHGNIQTSLYNLACAYALAGKKDRAFKHLEQAVSVGWNDGHHMQRDKDFISLRDDARFQAIVERTKGAKLLAKFGALDWDEALERAEKRVKKSPRSRSALEQLGWAAIFKGDPERAMDAFETVDQMKSSAVSRYNIACAFARGDHKDQAFTWLDRAFKSGWDDYRHMRRDDDMDNLRADARYDALITEMRNSHGSRHDRRDRKHRDRHRDHDDHDHDVDHDEDHDDHDNH